MAMPRSRALHEKCRKGAIDSRPENAPPALGDRKTRARRGFLRTRVRPVNAGGREGRRFFASRGWQAVCVTVVGRGLNSRTCLMRIARNLTIALAAIMAVQALAGRLFHDQYRDDALVASTWFGN